MSADNNYPIADRKIILDGKTYYAKRIILNSVKMCDDLVDKGCLPNKSLILKHPKLNDNLVRHFIRGYFDGDGCVSFNKNTKDKTVSILGTHDILEYIRANSSICDNRKILDACNNGYTFNLSLSSTSDQIIFYKYIYDNANIYLQRKKDIYDLLYSFVETSNPDIIKNISSDDDLIKHKRCGIPVVRISPDMSEVKIYSSSRNAYNDLFGKKTLGNTILLCCNHKQKMAYGYYWLQYKEYVNHKDNLSDYIANLFQD